MAIQRANLQRGPGSLQYGAALKIFSQADITATVNMETWRPSVSTHGEGAPRLIDAIGEITFTPSGRISADLLTGLYPAGFRNPVVGGRVFPATDTALLIHGIDQAKHNFPNAALTAMPNLVLSPKATAFEQATYTALIKDNADRTDTGAFFTTPTAAAWTETFNDSDVITVPYAGVYDDLQIPTTDGWKVSFELELEPIYVEGIGTVDYEIKGVKVSATCRPVTLSAANLMSHLRPEGLALGATMRLSKDLVITGATGGLVVTLYDAVLLQAPSTWGTNQPRAGEITFEASRQLTGEGAATTMGAVFAIDIAT